MSDSCKENRRRLIAKSNLFQAALKDIRDNCKKKKALQNESSKLDFVEKAAVDTQRMILSPIENKQSSDFEVDLIIKPPYMPETLSPADLIINPPYMPEVLSPADLIIKPPYMPEVLAPADCDSGFLSKDESPESSDCGCSCIEASFTDMTNLQATKIIKETFQNENVIKPKSSSLGSYSVQELYDFNEETFFDSHCHLDFIVNRAQFKGSFCEYRRKSLEKFPRSYGGCITAFSNPKSYQETESWRMLLEEKNVWASFGCHPKNAAAYDEEVEAALIRALEHPKVLAVGEIGLDYSNGSTCSVIKQKFVFRCQLRIAKQKCLPLVIHCRGAYDDCFDILKEELPDNYPIHLHGFEDKWSTAERFLKQFINLMIGITNIVTFPSAVDVHEVARKIPINKLLLETGAPFLVPAALSKEVKSSNPGMAIFVAAKIASLKNMPLSKVVLFTRLNTDWIYGI